MQLKGRFRVLGIKKKTSAVFFKELKVGDEFELVYSMSGRFESAPVIEIHRGMKLAHMNNALQLRKNLENFELEQTA